MPARPTTRAAECYAQPLLVRQLFNSALFRAPRQQIVHGDVCRLSYAEFGQRVARLANALTDLGVGQGSTVGVMDWDSHRYLECFFAVPMLGAVLHTVNIRLAPDQILYTINHAGDDILLVHRDFLPAVEPLRDRMTSVRSILVLDDAATAERCEYEAALASASAEFAFTDFDEQTPATTFYTTGTTGEPKGVWFSHRQLVLHTLGVLANTSTAGAHGGFSRQDVYMPLTPMFHVHAWGLPYVATMLGVKQVYPGRYLPERILALLRRERASFSHCVPAILHMLLEHPDAERTDFRGWKVIIGGSALPRGLARRALERGIDVYAGYGMSETCPVLTQALLDADTLGRPIEEQLDHRTRAGRPLPLVELRVVDTEMHDLPRDGRSAGEVVVRAPWLTAGYVGDQERSDALWRGGWLHTGDIGTLDSQGWLRITDRLKDVIKSGGEWISSLELEDIASRTPGVAESAAIGVRDEQWGERPLLLVVPAAGQQVERSAVLEQFERACEAGALPRWAIPQRIETVAAIDKTSVGKIDKKRLRERYRST